MDIQALSATELNRAMIWLYPKNWKDLEQFGEEVCYWDCAVEVHTIDYLTDWNLTMNLVVEHNLCIESPLSYQGGWWAHSEDLSARGDTLLRAICEILVMIGVERK